jgi:HAD superfamily hydrolase (TIGR01450 family)
MSKVCPVAVALDIDGVILRGGDVLSGAVDAVRRLKENNVPVVFMTNGGGVTEAEKARSLQSKLGIIIHEGQILLAHTPFKEVALRYERESVLVLGHGRALKYIQ